MGVDFHEWVGCGRSKANTPGHCDADPDDPNWCLPPGGEATKTMCWGRYVDYVEKCSGCTDPFIQRFLRTTAAATANTHCESCSQPQQISDKINQVCCAGDQNVEVGGVGLGIFADCGGDVAALLRKGKSC